MTMHAVPTTAAAVLLLLLTDAPPPVHAATSTCTPSARMATVCPAARGLFSDAQLRDMACQPWRDTIDQILAGEAPLPSKRLEMADGGVGRARFLLWMPPFPKACKPGLLTEYGMRGDSAYSLCGLDRTSPAAATVVSIGSRGDARFEQSVLQQSRANVEVFDCTFPRCPGPRVGRNASFWPESFRTGRLRYHQICLGRSDDLTSTRGRRSDWNQTGGNANYTFLSYPSIVRHLGLQERPVIMKMDIEGFEVTMLAEARTQEMPCSTRLRTNNPAFEPACVASGRCLRGCSRRVRPIRCRRCRHRLRSSCTTRRR